MGPDISAQLNFVLDRKFEMKTRSFSTVFIAVIGITVLLGAVALLIRLPSSVPDLVTQLTMELDQLPRPCSRQTLLSILDLELASRSNLELPLKSRAAIEFSDSRTKEKIKMAIICESWELSPGYKFVSFYREIGPKEYMVNSVLVVGPNKVIKSRNFVE